MNEKEKQGIRHRAVILGLAFVAAGFLALYLSADTDESAEPLKKTFLREFATIALIAGTLHVAYELFQRRDYLAASESATRENLGRLSAMEGSIMSRLSIAEQAHSLGLSDVRQDSNSFDFAAFLRTERRLKIVVNDGRTWVSNNSPHLRERLEDAGAETTFFLVHPNSTLLEVLARRDHSSGPAIAGKIEETINMIRLMCQPESKVKIWGHYLNNPHSVYLGDEKVLITSYFHSRVRRTVPLFCFEDRSDGCLFRETREDLEALELDSVLLFENPPAPLLNPAAAAKAAPSTEPTLAAHPPAATQT